MAAIRDEAPDAFRRHAVETLYFDASVTAPARRESPEGESYQVMLEVHERPATLLIIGGGHIGKALATIGNLCGFSVEIIDDRPEYANAERFPEADRITCGRFDEVLDGYTIDPNTYVVCVTRGHKHDETSLRLVAASAAAYVGMIGSKRRVGAVLQHLVEDGVDSRRGQPRAYPDRPRHRRRNAGRDRGSHHGRDHPGPPRRHRPADARSGRAVRRRSVAPI